MIRPAAKPANLPPSAAQMARHSANAAALLKALAHPARLLVLCQLVEGESSVGDLQPITGLSMSALSQHLAVLYRTGVLAKRKEGTQVIYRVHSEKAVALCRSVCTQIAIELDEPGAVPAGQSLAPRLRSASAVEA